MTTDEISVTKAAVDHLVARGYQLIKHRYGVPQRCACCAEDIGRGDTAVFSRGRMSCVACEGCARGEPCGRKRRP